VTTAVVKVKCYDYGAYGVLYALAILPSGLDLAHTKGNPEKSIVRIPVDNDWNYIGDAWEFNEPNASPQDDTDNYPPSNFFGDGLSRYDEYRGFIVVGGYKRLNPNKKDVFIFNLSPLLQQEDYCDFVTLGLETHFWDFQNADRDEALVTIYDKTAHISNQYGISVQYLLSGLRKIPDKDAYYLGYCDVKLPGSKGGVVTIYREAIRYYSAPNVGYDPLNPPERRAYMHPENVFMRYEPNYAQIEDSVDKEAIKSILAHELGHAVNLEHCPYLDCIMNGSFYFDYIRHTFCKRNECISNLKLH
jgi:hypothetical protein